MSSVGVPSGNAALRVVVGTELYKENRPYDTTVFVGDPGEREAYPLFNDVSPETVVLREHYQRVASLIGDETLFSRTEYPEAPSEKAPGPLIRRTVGDRVAVGSTLELRSDKATTGFFVGLDVKVREELLTSLGFCDFERVA